MDLKSILANIAKPETVSRIATETGQSPEAVQQIIENGLPLVLGKVGQNVSTKKGEASLSNALNQHSDGSILDTLSGLFGGGGSNSDGLAILGNIFGNKNDAAAKTVAKKSGVDAGTVMQVLSFVAPLVMAYLAQKKLSGGIKDTVQSAKDYNGNPLTDLVGQVLGGGNQKNGGVLGSILGGLLGGGSSSAKSSGSSSGGILGSILGSIFKKK